MLIIEKLSRYGYKDLDDLKTTIERNMKAGIPLETVVVDIDFMDRYKMFTVGKKIFARKKTAVGVLPRLSTPIRAWHKPPKTDDIQ
ncbi:hypothetical protein TELCIR_15713 [Teladorsagia circumcincta]|uniref:Glycoside hydrolase family 31 TIM barrel domain-containing protein n=1 Tax=Teladorsagia circumcincta TaxID=45464 RepID=A0A2G9TXQ1_TELCI|nr:hypothetical protein TELCIR_15713 [Teladorsagia circumcincta]